jgi:hypothetical protein
MWYDIYLICITVYIQNYSGAGMAELVACSLAELKVRGLKHHHTNKYFYLQKIASARSVSKI